MNGTRKTEQISFNGRDYVVTQELSVPALLNAEGLIRQCVIQGSRRATRLLQVWSDGTMRTITENARVEVQYHTTTRVSVLDKMSNVQRARWASADRADAKACAEANS